MKANSIFTRLMKTKGIGYIAVALIAGIALLVINLGGGESKAPSADKNAHYASEAEAALEELGRTLCGVKCQAKVRLGGGYSYTYACDQSVRTSYNPDGSVAEKEATLNNRTVNTSGGTSLVAVKETPPYVAGVVMVCKNATASDISALKAMISALYGLEDGAIFVTN